MHRVDTERPVQYRYRLPTKKQFEKLCSLQRTFFARVVKCKDCPHYWRENGHVKEEAKRQNRKMKKDETKCPRHRGPNKMAHIILQHDIMNLRDIRMGDLQVVNLSENPLTTIPQERYNTRRRIYLLPQVKTNAQKNTFSYRAKVSWNALRQDEIEAEKDRLLFKRKLTSKDGSFENHTYSEDKYAKNKQDEKVQKPYSYTSV